jgi:hypothetical protein
MAEGVNSAFNRYMDQRREDNIMYQTQIAKTLGSIDIPETLIEENKNYMAKRINDLRSQLITMTTKKKGFQRGQFGTEELLYVQQQSNQLAKEFSNLTAADRQIKQEMSLFNEGTHDRQEMISRLNAYQKEKIIPYGTLLSEKPKDVNQVIKGAYDLVDQIHPVPSYTTNEKGVPDPYGSIQVVPYSQIPQANQIKENAWGSIVSSEGGRKGLVNQMAMSGNPQELILLAANSGMDQKSIENFTQEIQAGLATGNMRMLENNPLVQKMAVDWGTAHVKPMILQDRMDRIDPEKRPKPTEEEENKVPYEPYENKPMPDGTTAPKAYVFKKPVDTTMPSEDMLTIDNKPLGVTGNVVVKIKEMGGHWAYGTATPQLVSISKEEYDSQGGTEVVSAGVNEPNKYYKKGVQVPVKIKIAKASRHIKSSIPELKDKIVEEKTSEIKYDVGGTPYTRQGLRDLGYSDKQIDNAIKANKIKKL